MENLLKKNISRLQILKYKNDNITKKIKIAVFRNHSFEHMEGMINKFLNASGLMAEFIYSDYDDSFNFSAVDTERDLNLIWIDFSRYNNIDVKTWFLYRINELKSNSKKPIFVYYTGTNISFDNTDNQVIIKNSGLIEKELGADFYDVEKFEYSGTNLSSKASVKIAQELGLKYLPSFFLTPLKAIVVDMDNTLYKGIVGEDGIKGVTPNIEFQKQLLNLSKSGILLSIASKNEYEDIKKLFEQRTDFPLKWQDFACHNISWESKDKAIINTAKQFNIGTDSILFIDDNLGEINFVKNCIPNVKTLIADEDILYKFNLYPLIQRYSASKEDSLRKDDIDANKKRNEILASLNKEEYFKSLQMEIEYSLDNANNFERAIQLINKTNQFIFSYKRYKSDEILENQHILTISLKDKLSDSGIIGIIVTHREEDILSIDELVVSCRALGRNIEDLMLNKSFEYLAEKLNTNKEIKFNFILGERNKPAKLWLENYCGHSIEENSIIRTKIKDNIENKEVKIIYNN